MKYEAEETLEKYPASMSEVQAGYCFGGTTATM